MRKIVAFLFLTILTVSCYTSEDQRRLQEECKSLNSQINYLQSQRSSLDNQISNLHMKVVSKRVEY